MPDRRTVIVFDVNETLSDLAPMAERFRDVGAPGHLATHWFATVLRDGFALAAAGSRERFSVLAREALRAALDREPLDRATDRAVEHILDGFATLPVHPDVPAGIRALRAAGYRMVTLSNGSVAVAGGLLTRSGIRDAVDVLLSVEQAPIWKPGRAAYEYAARQCGVEPARLLLVAVHPWDIHGAAHAGLRTAWVNRDGARYPAYFAPPTHTVSALTQLVAALNADEAGTPST